MKHFYCVFFGVLFLTFSINSQAQPVSDSTVVPNQNDSLLIELAKALVEHDADKGQTILALINNSSLSAIDLKRIKSIEKKYAVEKLPYEDIREVGDFVFESPKIQRDVKLKFAEENLRLPESDTIPRLYCILQHHFLNTFLDYRSPVEFKAKLDSTAQFTKQFDPNLKSTIRLNIVVTNFERLLSSLNPNNAETTRKLAERLDSLSKLLNDDYFLAINYLFLIHI